MKARTAARLAWALWGLSIASVAASIAISFANEIPGFDTDVVGTLAVVVAFAAFPTVGAVVASRRPENTVAWLFIAIGVIVSVGGLCQVYAEYTIGILGERTTLSVTAAWIAMWYWFPALGLTTIFTLLLFPDGHVPSPRWRPLAVVAGAATAGMSLVETMTARLTGSSYSIPNPVGFESLGDVESSTIGSVLFVVYFACLVGAGASLIVRFRRSRGDERQQVKWFAYAGAALVVIIFLSEVIPVFKNSSLPFAVGIGLLPVATGIAILKYRLYDLDRLVNRTLVYGALTVVLVLVYMGGVVGVGGLLSDVTGVENNSLAVAASTLAVAALFRPARGRIQNLIDQRFYRRRYDSARTLDAFASRLRDEVELDALTTDLLGVVRQTVQPAHASLWLRDDEKVQR